MPLRQICKFLDPEKINQANRSLNENFDTDDQLARHFMILTARIETINDTPGEPLMGVF